MGHIGKFEELIAWQKARDLTKAIYEATRCEKFAKDFGLAGQIQRAAVSIMSNVAEGFERDNRGDFHCFLSIAKGSCAEVRSQLYIALDTGYLTQADFQKLITQAEEVARIIGGLRASVEKQRQKL
ncbi:MAG: four helix bundle protein [Chloroflexi bacterium]|nr:four helix bundle protein [Chloroflexota bacterium]